MYGAGRHEARGRVPKTGGHVGLGVVTSGWLRAPQSTSSMDANMTATRVMTHHYANARNSIALGLCLALR